MGSSRVQCVEHIRAQLRRSFPPWAGLEHGSEGLGPPCHHPTASGYGGWMLGVTGGDWWHPGQAVSRQVPVGDVRTQPHAHHTLGIAGWGCWGTLVSPPRCSPAPCLWLSTPPAVPAPCRVPTATTDQGGVMGLWPCPGGASPLHSGDTVFCMEHPLCSPYRDDPPPVCPCCPPPGGAGWGSRGGRGTGAASAACREPGGSWPETSQAAASGD